MTLSDQIQANAAALKEQGLYRKRTMLPSNTLLQFSSNDYLSLTSDKQVSTAYQEGFQKYPCGSGGSPVVCGYHEAHRSLENAFAELLGVDDCLLFASGYAANLAVTRLLGSLNAHCLIDKSIHASVYDGLRLSNVSFNRYLHNDLIDFSNKMRHISANSAVLTEGIFSMSGQRAPLAKMSQLCQNQGSIFIVDEAHAFGILGNQGKGAVVFEGLDQQTVPLRIIPLGKAFAGQGAIVAGLGNWIDALLQSARSLIYSTAMSPALAYGLRKTLDIVVNADERRNKLLNLINSFRQAIATSSYQWSDSKTPIQQLRLGKASLALKIAEQLQNKGISCQAMRYPTVSHADTGLRIILNYHHEPEDIQQLFTALEYLKNEY